MVQGKSLLFWQTWRWQIGLGLLAAGLLSMQAMDLPEGSLGAEIFWQLRLPRLALAALSGATLALAGLWLQTLFRTALVEPGLLGVSSGAALTAIIFLVLWPAAWVWMPLAAIVGGTLSLLAVLALARRYQLQGEALLLVGIALNALLAAIMQMLLLISPDQALRASSFWLMGSFAYAEPRLLLPAALMLLLLTLWGWRRASAFDLWLLGEREAGYLGLPVARFRQQVIWASAALTALAVVQAGSVAFIGLMAPHMASRWVGCSHRALTPVVLIIGALLAVLADTLARTLLSPLEIPVGILTALLGAPFFLVLLRMRWQR
ncbi:MAG: iron ABC transporter permease [Pseudomonadota bacterium]